MYVLLTQNQLRARTARLPNCNYTQNHFCLFRVIFSLYYSYHIRLSKYQKYIFLEHKSLLIILILIVTETKQKK